MLDVMTVLCNPFDPKKPNVQYTVAMMYSMAMYNRNSQLSALHKANTAAAVRLHTSINLLDIFHKVGITPTSGSKILFPGPAWQI